MSIAGVRIELVVEIARAAGAAIMEVYEREYEIIEKADGSPVTTADHRAHDIIDEDGGDHELTKEQIDIC